MNVPQKFASHAGVLMMPSLLSSAARGADTITITPAARHQTKADIYDLSILLYKWNTSDAAADINKNGVADMADLSLLLGNWS